jgi:hypothetical protein
MFKITITEIEEIEVRRTYQETVVDVKLVTDKEIYMQIANEINLVKIINAINDKGDK